MKTNQRRLLIATTNQAKLQEHLQFLAPLREKGIGILSLKDFAPIEEPEETGETLGENAVLKAHYYGDITQMPVLSDDGGFEIDALGGEPGVKSNRWLGRKATDQELINYTLKRLEGVPFEKRTAQGRLCLTYYNPHSGKEVSVSNAIDGIIAEKAFPHFIPGFPYRALFYLPQFSRYYDELTAEEHDEVNHRKKAVLQIIPHILADLVE
ncbi:MAG: non-canonical purine NTP pyrophosphatase [Patescibacteria group bacterium]|nr:non-canonical purine NTP pyrophosphatase [Patescibacteria group bacterium]